MNTDIAVAVINNSEDTVEMLRFLLLTHGFTRVVTAHVPDIRRGDVDVREFLRVHDPRVLIWDVSIPYEENWAVLQNVLRLDEMVGRHVVLTTTNKSVLERLVGATPALEVHGKPYDLDRIMAAVEREAATVVAPPPAATGAP